MHAEANHISKDHLQAIGEITVNFADLEFQICVFIWTLIDEPHIGRIITAELSFKGLLALLSSLHRDLRHSDKEFKEIQKLVKRASKIEEERNKITHSLWYLHARDSSMIVRAKTTAKRKDRWKVIYEDISLSKLNEISKNIAKLSNDISIAALMFDRELKWNQMMARKDSRNKIMILEKDDPKSLTSE